ncbi:hypothetical protein G9A89_012655 [Geosiphon pyriformis]|nr:hypothetical protein G9A89_012655 [Geosiphon pyriformis]
MVDLLAELLFANMLLTTSIKHAKSWDSKIDSKKNSVSKVLDVKNIKNTITEKTSYIDSNAFETDNMINNAILRKIHMRTYVLGQLPNVLFFNSLSNDGAELMLLVFKFSKFYKLLLAELHNMEVRNFNSVKSFTLDIELLAILGKTNNDKLIAIKKFFY